MELFKRQKNTIGKEEKTLLVYVELANNNNYGNTQSEFKELARSSNLNIVKFIKVNIHSGMARFFIGSGKVKQISEMIIDLALDLIIFSIELSPSQERNLEQSLNCQIMDRTSLILDIFALRASSFEGKLQVELAQLEHLSTRLVCGWTHLERQKGGIGMRGPGETQLETDKRLIAIRIKNITKRLNKVRKQRNLGRQSRLKNELPMIALAGYTNAGKSTLFNTLTNAQVFTNNQFFATLDSTIRRVTLPASGDLFIADTVGFIQDLPHHLIDAFKSTLEETKHANVLLHVVDAFDDYSVDKINQVKIIINEIEAADIPVILVMNKIDCLEDFTPRIDRDKNARIYRVWLSGKTGNGINLLYKALAEQLSGVMVRAKIKLAVSSAYVRSEIYNIGYICNEKMNDFGEWVLEINVTHHYLSKLLNKKGIKLLWEQKPL